MNINPKVWAGTGGGANACVIVCSPPAEIAVSVILPKSVLKPNSSIKRYCITWVCNADGESNRR